MLNKGIHYFDTAERFRRGPRFYAAHFPLRHAAGHSITGEASPYYLFHPLAAARIAEQLKSVKIIVLLRDPAERAFSAHKQEQSRGFESLPFEEALAAEPERLAGEEERIMTDPAYQSFAHQHHAYQARGRYAGQLERMFAAVGREQVLVLDADDFFVPGLPHWDRLLEHLGLPDWRPPASVHTNARPSKPMPQRLRRQLLTTSPTTTKDSPRCSARHRAGAGSGMVLTLLRDPRGCVSEPLTQAKTPARPRSLQGYTALVRHNWLTSVAVMAASLAIGLGFHFTSEAEYTARTDVVVVAVSDLTLNGERTVDVSIDSAVQLLLSDRVLGQTARSLNYPGGVAGLRKDVTVSPIINSRILQLFVSAPEARIAHGAVSALADNFLKMRRDSLTAAAKDRAKTIAAQQAVLKRSIETGVAINDGPDADFDIGKLNRERVQLEAELTALNIHEPDPGYISKAAVIPESAQRQGLLVRLGSALAAGMTVACGLAALKHHRGTPRHRKKEGAS